MRRTALFILAGAAAVWLGVIGVPAQGQQAGDPPRIPTSSTGPVVMEPLGQSRVPVGGGPCRPGSSGPCNPGDPRPAGDGPGAGAISEGPVAPCPPGQRPPCHADNSGPVGRAAIGEPTSDTTVVYRFCYLRDTTNHIGNFRANCPFPGAFRTNCTVSGGRLSESDGAVECGLPSSRVARFDRSMASAGPAGR